MKYVAPLILGMLVTTVIVLLIYVAVYSVKQQADSDACFNAGLIPVRTATFHNNIVCVKPEVLVAP